MHSKVYFVVCVMILFSLQTLAQLDIDTIEISTTQIPMKSSETGRNITVLDADDISNLAFSSLDGLLQVLPGIEVQTRNAFGVQGDISMRGSTFTQVLVLVNGMKLNDPLTGHFNSAIPVSPHEIERIEILRGAASANYGADAVGGVINIITKTFSNPGFQATGEINYGKNNLIASHHGISYRTNKFFVSGGINYNKSDGETIDQSFLQADTLEAYDNYFDIRTIGVSLGYKFSNKWSATFRAANDTRDFNARYFYTNSVFDKSTEITSQWLSQMELKHVGRNSVTRFQTAYRNGEDTFIFSPDFPSTNEHTTGYLNFQFNHMRTLNEKTRINIGAQIDQRDIISTDRGDHDDLHYATYASLLFQPLDGFSLTTSLRWDHDENYDSEITPQLNVSYQKENLVLRASSGKSIRAADYTERYVSFNLENLTPGRSLGNPNLKAEKSWSHEIGLDYNLSNQFQIKTSIFLRQSSDLIDYVQTNSSDIENNQNLQENADYFLAQNITDVSTKGFELIGSYVMKLSDQSNLGLELGYTLLNTSNEEDIISVYISRHAKHLLNTRLSYSISRLNLSLNGVYKNRDQSFSDAIGAEIKASYYTLNTMLRYFINDDFALQLKCFNLTNHQNQDVLGAPLPGIWWTVGVHYQL